jgi:hypothetical protein
MFLATVLLAFQTPAPVPTSEARAFALETLAERQVVQRDAKNGADVLVDGSCADAPALVVRVLRGGERIAARAAELQDLPGPRARFHASVRVPAGGWYALELAETESSPALFTLARFGVGEVFVVAGQSNSTNFGEERSEVVDDRVSSYDGEQWRLARDPMTGVQDGSYGGSPWPRFGQLLVQAFDVPVAIASCGYGGTSIRWWQKGHRLQMRADPAIVLFDGLIQRLEAVGRVRAVLWHQGESDAAGALPSAEYVALFTQLKAAVANELDGQTPQWVVARASYLPGIPEANREAIRAAQTELWTSGVALRGPDTDDMLGELRHSKDHVHFSKAGLEVHATRWFDAVRAVIAPPDAKPGETKAAEPKPRAPAEPPK